MVTYKTQYGMFIGLTNLIKVIGIIYVQVKYEDNIR